ncbi:EAL domain-containing protein [Rhodobacteraceae bacterium RKSG542]|uniref:EAL domain-containing protein n=1 Tax=Pseudovibrio flavus TaxID=2529854 RepID=UPI0012BD0756|nr:EAL domain-containing protein [Pseudovibrio flavus]MTI18842.1 EAL domain-containing protein [Pseudovibrio flavus]
MSFAFVSVADTPFEQSLSFQRLTARLGSVISLAALFWLFAPPIVFLACEVAFLCLAVALTFLFVAGQLQLTDVFRNEVLRGVNSLAMSAADEEGKREGVKEDEPRWWWRIIDDKKFPEEMEYSAKFLIEALEKRQFVLYYQPQISVANGDVVGVEALLRWMPSPDERVMPDAFLPQVEAIGRLPELTRQVLTQAIEATAALHRSGNVISMAVNLSARDLEDNSLPLWLKNEAQKWKLAPKSIELEITETAPIHDSRQAQINLSTLRSFGFLVSLDDFGTGHSNLERLADHEVDALKIDRRFIQAMEDDKKADTVILAIVQMCRNLGLKSVAEGVETQDQVKRLAAVGVDTLQGFYYSPPLSQTDLRAWLRAWKGRNGSRPMANTSLETIAPS